MHVNVNMHVTLVLHACCTGVGNGSACTMHVVRVLSNMHVGRACNMHVPCMLYECWSNKHVGSACNMHVV